MKARPARTRLSRRKGLRQGRFSLACATPGAWRDPACAHGHAIDDICWNASVAEKRGRVRADCAFKERLRLGRESRSLTLWLQGEPSTGHRLARDATSNGSIAPGTAQLDVRGVDRIRTQVLRNGQRFVAEKAADGREV